MLEADTAPDLHGRILAATHEPFLDAWSSASARIDHRVVRTLRGSLERHRAVIESVGLFEPPPEAQLARADGLLEYRRVFASEVLHPLEACLVSGPGQLFADSIVAATEEATRQAASPVRARSRRRGGSSTTLFCW